MPKTINKLRVWQVFTFIFAFLFLVMLVVSIYQRQYLYTEDEVSNLYKTPNETIIYDENDTVQKDYIQINSFLLYEDSYIDLNFNSDTPSNLYLLDDSEYLRYDNG